MSTVDPAPFLSAMAFSTFELKSPNRSTGTRAKTKKVSKEERCHSTSSNPLAVRETGEVGHRCVSTESRRRTARNRRENESQNADFYSSKGLARREVPHSLDSPGTSHFSHSAEINKIAFSIIDDY